MMPLISSLVVVALAERDDKTQLIALTLELRYCRFRVFSMACEIRMWWSPTASLSAAMMPIDYRAPSLVNEHGIMATNGFLHEAVLASIARDR